MVELRKFLSDDFENVLDLLWRNNLYYKNSDSRELRHLWENNPVFLDRKEIWPMGWVLEKNNGEIVGFFGNIPVAYEFRGKKLIAAVASTWAIDVAYRQYAMLLIKSYFSQKQADLFINATANDVTGKIFSAFKARKVPVDKYGTISFWIVDYQKFIIYSLAKKGVPLANFISYPLSWAIKGIRKLRGSGFDIKDTNRRINCLYDFDERFNVFWAALRKRYHNEFLCVRNRVSLNWHFKHTILNRRIWIFTAEEGSCIVSYAVFLRQDNSQGELKEVWLVDFQTVSDDPYAFREILAACMKKCQKEKIHVLRSRGFHPQISKIDKKFSPYKTKPSNNLFFYKAKDKLVAQELGNSDLWNFCLFDGDASLFRGYFRQ
jgi:hypothetical protein